MDRNRIDFDRAYSDLLDEQKANNSEYADDCDFLEELYDLYEANSEELTEDEFYDEISELVCEDDDENLSESDLSITQRKKKSRLMRRIAKQPKVQKARERSFRKGKSFAEWTKRGMKAFRRFFKKKLLMKKRGKTLETATAKDKTAIEKILSSDGFKKKFKSKVRKFTLQLKKREKEMKSRKKQKAAETKANDLLPKSND